MGFESGLVVLWDLRTKTAESRFIGAEPLRSASWHSEGKQFVSAHGDGSLFTWQVRSGPRPAPVSVAYPHGKPRVIASFRFTEPRAAGRHVTGVDQYPTPSTISRCSSKIIGYFFIHLIPLNVFQVTLDSSLIKLKLIL